MSTQADRLTKLTSQLVGDIGRLEGVTLDQTGEQQLVQLLTDAFEAVGHIAMDGQQRCPLADCALDYPHQHQNMLQVTAHPGDVIPPDQVFPLPPAKSCGCVPYQSCHTCVPLPGGITF